ncbi:diaminopimelate epimerase [Nocardioides euryhalodurans]|uniref:Diaminopimelate epimerase n=1 Tax=Nocardioides euryhalodurans TaxID=2518370 RepID=A0A4P7GJX8_9ACTN|nr:diaminopimelate epimerase [Nocardioides euryhalodurans]QBR92295.1 diaminopimelate epimerase [Nocardioides euryhalodurans]
MAEYSFHKGHGTENDFVIVPAEVELSPERVRALCDRRAGIGGDGVIRAVREDGRWFMDYRNSDGSTSEMCGNGIRLFARYLHEVEGEPFPMDVGSRDGVKTLTCDDEGLVTVDMGVPRVLDQTVVGVDGRSWPATHVDMGNPHAVAFVDDLADAGTLLDPPDHDAGTYPEGVNVEFVVRRGERHVAMRVHERGSGETRSCGTGACAVMVAAAVADGLGPGTAYRVDVPGGTLTVTWTTDERVLLTGPAVIVARGTTSL